MITMKNTTKLLAAPLLALAALASTTNRATAQDLTVTAPPQDHPVVLAGGTVHTVSGETIEDGVVIFNEGEITNITTADALRRMSFTEDTEIIDVRGARVYPGLIASMTRLGLTEVGAVRATHDYNELGAMTPEARAIVAVNPDSTIIPVTRTGGVLLAGVFPQGDPIPGRASIIRLEGWTWEEMAATGDPRTDAGLVINWPSARTRADRWTGKVSNDREKSRKQTIAALHEFFDDARSYMEKKDRRPGDPEDLRFEAVIPVLKGNMPAFINASDVEQIHDAVGFANRHGLRMVLTGGRDAPLCADLLIENDIPVIVAGTHTWPKRADAPHDDAYTLPARLRDAGVKFALNGADRDGNIRNLPHEAAMAARYGLTDDEAAATPQAEGVTTRHLTAGEAIRTRGFWMISFGHAFALLVVVSSMAHLALYLTEDRGYSAGSAAVAAGVVPLVQIVGTAAGGYLGDRINKRLISGVAMQMHGAALLILVWGDAGFAIVIFIVLHGFAWGVRGPQMQAIRADYFGSTSFATIMGWSNIIVTMGAIAGPVIAAPLADATGD